MRLIVIIASLIIPASLVAETTIGLGLNASRFYDGESSIKPGVSFSISNINEKKKILNGVIEAGLMNRSTMYKDRIVFHDGQYHQADLKFALWYVYFSPLLRYSLLKTGWYFEGGLAFLLAIKDISSSFISGEPLGGEPKWREYPRYLPWTPSEPYMILSSSCIDVVFHVGKTFRQYSLSLQMSVALLGRTENLNNIWLKTHFSTISLVLSWKIPKRSH